VTEGLRGRGRPGGERIAAELVIGADASVLGAAGGQHDAGAAALSRACLSPAFLPPAPRSLPGARLHVRSCCPGTFFTTRVTSCPPWAPAGGWPTSPSPRCPARLALLGVRWPHVTEQHPGDYLDLGDPCGSPYTTGSRTPRLRRGYSSYCGLVWAPSSAALDLSVEVGGL